MAVVQISRIQIRRGQKNSGTGLPQLASGEMAWAIDTQELYIGNGAVSEGAPAVGNTKVITAADNLLDIGTYTYKEGNGLIQTGDDPNYPIVRSLQDRLDERVTAASFGIVPDTEQDQTVAIQRAIDNLYLINRSLTTLLPENRVVLEFAPGNYHFSTTVYLPSYVAIVGAGKDKTIFNYTGATGTCFEFINDSSTATSRSVISSTTYINQPKNCLLKGFTLNTNEPDVTGFKLSAVRDSVFEDISVTGGYGDSSISLNSMAFGLYALSGYDYGGGVTTQRNYFKNITIDGFNYGVIAKQDISNNIWEGCNFLNSRYGIMYGNGADLFSSGEKFGPRFNVVKNSFFNNIDRNAILIVNGYSNRSQSNTFINCGSDGSGNTALGNTFNIIWYLSRGNTSVQDTFDRAADLADNFVLPYRAEVAGEVSWTNENTNLVTLATSTPAQSNLFRIPFYGNTGFRIEYILKSNNYTQRRSGTITVMVDSVNLTTQLSDDYNYVGTAGQETRINFFATISGYDILISYTNANPADITEFRYSYSVIS